MKKYKHKIYVINSPLKIDGFAYFYVFRKNRKKRWSRNRYERIYNKVTFKWESKFLNEEDIVPVPLILIPNVED